MDGVGGMAAFLGGGRFVGCKRGMMFGVYLICFRYDILLCMVYERMEV